MMKTEMLRKIENKEIVVGVVGLGYVGLPLAVEKAKAGFKTIGFDVQPQKVEMALWKIIPPEEGSDLCHRFVMHGRAVCNARKPECEKCCLNDICRYAREQSGADTAQ